MLGLECHIVRGASKLYIAWESSLCAIQGGSSGGTRPQYQLYEKRISNTAIAIKSVVVLVVHQRGIISELIIDATVMKPVYSKRIQSFLRVLDCVWGYPVCDVYNRVRCV